MFASYVAVKQNHLHTCNVADWFMGLHIDQVALRREG